MLKRAKAVKGLGDKVITAQMEFSPFELRIENNGFADAAKELGIAIVAYSPFARGLLTGRYVHHDYTLPSLITLPQIPLSLRL